MVDQIERSTTRETRWSANSPLITICSLYTIFSCFFLYCSARDTITINSLLEDGVGETLVSAGKRFELGFFTPNKTSDNRRYVGIWYYNSNPRIVVWVANRGDPLPDSSGVLAVDGGNLKLVDKNGKSYWHTNVSYSANRVAKLMDSGNLVLSDDQLATSLWESFKDPTDTFLTGMTLDDNIKLTSWISEDDPGLGNYTFMMDQKQYVILKSDLSHTYWRSKVSGKFFSADEMPSTINGFLSQSSFSNLTNASAVDYNYTRLIMTFTGHIECWREDKVKGWALISAAPRDRCSLFNFCGNFGICNSTNKPECECLPGFEPRSSGEFSGGCTRKTEICGRNDRFISLTRMKMENEDLLPIPVRNKTECLMKCTSNCQCQAYSYLGAQNSTRRDGSTSGPTCWIWTEDLKGLQVYYAHSGRDLYVRVAAADTENGTTMQGGGGLTKQEGGFYVRKKHWKLIVGVTVPAVIVLFCTIIYFYFRRKKVKRQGDRESHGQNMAVRFYDSARHVKDLVDTDFKEEDKKAIDLPFFDFESILAATDNFSEANKLGKGGFGPVYKGKFPEGQEIAVKRLSSVSGQGLEEFKNEVVLIARLQHRNLVRLLGYCIAGGEKILLYEYMPNKSLDSFIFDPTLSVLLDWEIRFNIITGIARGLLYLHQDSRLRIIHRDLKTSNVLLDQEMNPKISDFGLARIFEGKQTEGTTSRVVGTYGYMSPEYALDGFFSVKSDVFSFGVVVLEIVSGKRNTGFYNAEEALSLLGYAWRLWQEDKALDIMDQKLSASSKINEILKCINVGLLCVQEDPNDRPNMSNVVVMLGSETATLPTPNRPAFVTRRGASTMASSSSTSKAESNTQLTVSLIGR